MSFSDKGKTMGAVCGKPAPDRQKKAGSINKCDAHALLHRSALRCFYGESFILHLYRPGFCIMIVTEILIKKKTLAILSQVCYNPKFDTCEKQKTR